MPVQKCLKLRRFDEFFRFILQGFSPLNPPILGDFELRFLPDWGARGRFRIDDRHEKFHRIHVKQLQNRALIRMPYCRILPG